LSAIAKIYKSPAIESPAIFFMLVGRKAGKGRQRREKMTSFSRQYMSAFRSHGFGEKKPACFGTICFFRRAAYLVVKSNPTL
jgi:hypothetical protein